MPNRIIPESWILDERFETAEITARGSETFFRRLQSVIDDYGRYSANLTALKSAVFPLRKNVRDSDIARWLDALSLAGLLVVRDSSRGRYVEVADGVLYEKVTKDAPKRPKFGPLPEMPAKQEEMRLFTPVGGKPKADAVPAQAGKVHAIEYGSGSRSLSSQENRATGREGDSGRFARTENDLDDDRWMVFSRAAGLIEMTANGALWLRRWKTAASTLFEAAQDWLSKTPEQREQGGGNFGKYATAAYERAQRRTA